MIITFTDGTTTTTQELAALVRAEGRLIAYAHIDAACGRCVKGVAENWTTIPSSPGHLYGPQHLLSVESRDGLAALHAWVNESDDFVGTPEERCEYMAGLLERIP